MHNITVRKDLKLKCSLLWLKQGFITFREKPLQFIILQLIAYTLTLLPFLGAFLVPLFMSRFAFCASKVEKHEQLTLKDVFRDFFSNRLILRLAFLNFCLTSIVLLIQYYIEMKYQTTNLQDSLMSSLLIMILAVPLFFLNISMWLSPALCLFNDDIEPKSAMWLSIKVCFYNILVFLAFSILVGGITLIIGAPFLLLILKVWDLTKNVYFMVPLFLIAYIIGSVWLAIMNITTYYVYKMVYQKASSINS